MEKENQLDLLKQELNDEHNKLLKKNRETESYAEQAALLQRNVAQSHGISYPASVVGGYEESSISPMSMGL